jgi:protein-tyrosine phosphatase
MERRIVRPDVFWIGDVLKGRLGIASRPRGGDWLDDEVRAWSDSGVNSVVSLLTPSEEAELELNGEKNACRRHGIRFRSLAIPDRGVPQSNISFKRLASAVLNDLKSGKTVVVHCRQGIGRASMVVASAMALAGENPNEAFGRIQRARGRPVPDTDRQRDWVRHFADAARRSAKQPRPSSRGETAPKARVGTLETERFQGR